MLGGPCARSHCLLTALPYTLAAPAATALVTPLVVLVVGGVATSRPVLRRRCWCRSVGSRCSGGLAAAEQQQQDQQ
jgi:hypothetical protein